MRRGSRGNLYDTLTDAGGDHVRADLVGATPCSPPPRSPRCCTGWPGSTSPDAVRPLCREGSARRARRGAKVLTLLAIAALMSRHALQDSASRYGVLVLALGALAVVIVPRAGAAGAVVLY